MKKMKLAKISVLLFFIAVCTNTSVAQGKIRVKETHGDLFEQKGRGFIDVVELPNGGYMSLSVGSAGGGLSIGSFIHFVQYKALYYIQRYDKNLDLVEQKQLDIDHLGKNLAFEKLVKFQNEFYVFSTFVNKKNKKKYLFYSKLNVEKMALEGSFIKVAEVKDPAAKTGYEESSFDISLSKDEKYMVVFGKDAEPIKKKSKSFFGKSSKQSKIGTYDFKFTFWVLDKDFEIVNYEKNYAVTLKESSDKFYVRDFAVDDKGAIYILGKNNVVDELTRAEVKSNKRATWVDINKSAFVLEKINADGTTEQYITPENDLFVDMNILFDKKGNINLVGLNGEQVYAKLATTGVSRIVLDNDNLDEISNVNDNFTEDVLENVNDIMESEKAIDNMKNGNRKGRIQKKAKKKLAKMTPEQKAYFDIKKRAALNVNSIAFSGLDENGDAMIVLEEQHLEIVTTTYTDANGRTTTTTTYYYHYDDLIFTKFIGDDVVQNYYKKSFVSINAPLQKSMDVSLKDGELTVMTQGHIVKSDGDLTKVRDAELKAFSRSEKIPGMKRKYFTYRKTVNEDTILAPAQNGKKVVWYKITVD